jgi:thymidylate kinase
MSYPIRFVIFEGMDNCGKTTQIARLLKRYPEAIEVKFPKTLPSGALLRINTEKDFELLFSVFDLLDPRKIYLLDRFIPSNLVYDKVLRGENTELSQFYWKEFNRRFDVTTVLLTRPNIHEDFVDDRIKLTRKQFNLALQEYRQFGYNYQLLDRDENDRPTRVRPAEQAFIDELIDAGVNQL